MKNIVIHTVITIAIIVISFMYSQKPLYNWDMLPYMGAALTLTDDSKNIHKTVYTTAQENIAPKFYSALTTGKYREKIQSDSQAFTEQLSFYTVKPLYIWAIAGATKLGIPIIEATVVPSLIAILLLTLGVYIYLYRLTSLPLISGAVALFFLTFEPIQQMARLSSPDALSTLLVALSAFWVVKKKPYPLIVISMMLTLLARPDNILFCIILLLIHHTELDQRKQSFRSLLYGTSCLVVSYIALSVSFDSQGWSTLYYHSFVERVYYPISDNVNLGITHYVIGLVKRAFYLMNPVIFAAAIFLIGVHLIKIHGFKNMNIRTLPLFYKLVLGIFVLFVIRVLLFPTVESRHYTVYGIILLFSVIEAKKSTIQSWLAYKPNH